jgi:calcium-dependent protein kinase
MDDDIVKLIDFGTSRRINEKHQMQGVYGTSFFIAPEVIEHNYSEKCDIWSVGVILYMLIAGRPPFDGHTDQEIVKAILNGKYDLDSEVWSHMSAELKDLI